jgi:hypothetical protein
MVRVPNTSNLPRPRGISSIPENYPMNEVWKFAVNAIQEE